MPLCPYCDKPAAEDGYCSWICAYKYEGHYVNWLQSDFSASEIGQWLDYQQYYDYSWSDGTYWGEEPDPDEIPF